MNALLWVIKKKERYSTFGIINERSIDFTRDSYAIPATGSEESQKVHRVAGKTRLENIEVFRTGEFGGVCFRAPFVIVSAFI